MKNKFESYNAEYDKKVHARKFASMEDALEYFESLGKVAVVKTTYDAVVGGLTRGASTQVYPCTWIHLYAHDHDFGGVDGDAPDDVIIIQEYTPIAYPLVRLGLSTLTGNPSKPGCIGR